MKIGESRSTTLLRVSAFEAALLRFINAELLLGSNLTLHVDSALFEDGIIDSLKILHLLAFIESAIGRAIPDEEIVMKHFRTVRIIAERFASEHRVDEN
jgi:acyl carrier protein